LAEPVVTSAHWYSYTRSFVSDTAELKAAMTSTRQVEPDIAVCVVAGLDDQKRVAHARRVKAQFILRVGHAERLVDVYTDRLPPTQRETGGDLIRSMPPGCTLETTRRHHPRPVGVHPFTR
jgi:hypothetical protein